MGEDLGELFQYVITTPVTVGRGQSAMVPIVSSDLRLPQRSALQWSQDGRRTPWLRCDWRTRQGLTLERGPVTVIDGGEYVGEALLPFTAAGGEIVVPYAVELGVKVREEVGSSRQISWAPGPRALFARRGVGYPAGGNTSSTTVRQSP